MSQAVKQRQYLTFIVENKCYGINVVHVIEIVSMQKITQVPEMPQYIKGIMNLRGTIIPVMDIRLRFNLEEKKYNDRSCIIILNIGDIDIGVVIDEIAEVLTIHNEDLVRLPNGYKEGNEWVEHIVEIDEQIKILLDGYKLIDANEETKLAEEQDELDKKS